MEAVGIIGGSIPPPTTPLKIPAEVIFVALDSER